VQGGPVKIVHQNRLKPCYIRPETGVQKTGQETQITDDTAQSLHGSPEKDVLPPPAIEFLGEDIAVVAQPSPQVDVDPQCAPDPAPPVADIQLVTCFT
jgi:hypothetical protein